MIGSECWAGLRLNQLEWGGSSGTLFPWGIRPGVSRGLARDLKTAHVSLDMREGWPPVGEG